MAAHSEYTEELGIEICRRVAEGEPLTKVCKSVSMPHLSTVYRWLRDIPEFDKLMRIARFDQAATLFSQAIEIADEPPPMDVDADGTQRISSAGVQAQRLRVDTRKWAAARLLPKAYGERVELTGAGGERLMPAQTEVDVIEVARKVAFVLHMAERERIARGMPEDAITVEVSPHAALVENEAEH
jgi:hypothetical protein